MGRGYTFCIQYIEIQVSNTEQVRIK